MRVVATYVFVPVALFVAGRKSAPPEPERTPQIVQLERAQEEIREEARQEEKRAGWLRRKLIRAKQRIARLGRTARQERTKAWALWRLTRAPRALDEHVSSSGLVGFGQILQQKGYGVSEHPAFGGVDAGHAPNSYHYRGEAIDVTGGDLDWVASEARRLGFNVYWQVAGHYDHVHVDTGPVRPL